MVKINNVSETHSGRAIRKAKNVKGGFAPSSTARGTSTTEVASVENAAAASVMNVLIGLQGEPGAQTYAAAQRSLELLDQLKLKILEGQASAEDLSALAKAASTRARADADPALLAVYDEISLRARVELAKLGQ